MKQNTCWRKKDTVGAFFFSNGCKHLSKPRGADAARLNQFAVHLLKFNYTVLSEAGNKTFSTVWSAFYRVLEIKRGKNLDYCVRTYRFANGGGGCLLLACTSVRDLVTYSPLVRDRTHSSVTKTGLGWARLSVVGADSGDLAKAPSFLHKGGDWRGRMETYTGACVSMAQVKHLWSDLCTLSWEATW